MRNLFAVCIALGAWVFGVHAGNVAQPEFTWFRSSRLLQTIPNASRLLATRPLELVDWYHRNDIPAVGPGRGWELMPFEHEPSDTGPGLENALARYGTTEDSWVLVRIGTEVLAISPWIQNGDEGMARLEHARSLWLREQGLVGEVRHFQNPIVEQPKPQSQQSVEEIPEPAARFLRPLVLPRTQSVEQVRYSLPPGMCPLLAQVLHTDRVNERTAER